MRVLRSISMFSLVFSMLACGDKSAGGEAAGGGTPKKSAADLLPAFEKDAVAAVTAARPSGASIEFGAASVDDGKVLAVVPKGWEESKVIPGSYKPPKEPDLGFMTSYKVGTNCDGMCSAKDWKATAEKVNFGQFRNADSFEITDERALTNPEGRIVVAKAKSAMGPKVHIAAARWKEGASRYYTCFTTLEGEAAVALMPVFVKACELGQAVELQ